MDDKEIWLSPVVGKRSQGGSLSLRLKRRNRLICLGQSMDNKVVPCNREPYFCAELAHGVGGNGPGS